MEAESNGLSVRRSSITISVAWLAFLLTVFTQALALTFFLARLENGLTNVNARADKLEAENVMHETAIRKAEEHIQYLCNERRRDNLEDGRNGAAIC